MSSPNVVGLGGGWRLSLGPALKALRVNIGPHRCSGTINSRNTCYTWTLTKMWLTLPDGSEVELRDQYTQGAPHYVGSETNPTDRWRGRVWQTTDGSAATFVSDADNGVVNGQLAGWVFLADGTRLRMEAVSGAAGVGAARCTEIVDRNGNFVTISADSTTGNTSYTDELGRQTIVGWASPSVLTVTSKGYAGVPDRVVSVNIDRIGAADGASVLSNLRAEFRDPAIYPRPFTSGDYARTSQGDLPHTIAGPHTDLFLGSESGDNIDDHFTVARVDLLDGHSLRFRYNQYGEVAEVVYPGGGVSQIDYQGFQTSVCAGVAPYTDTLDRRVSQRRLMTDGSTVDATWSYTHGTGSVGGVSYPTATLEARQGNGGTLLLSETHYFLAIKAEYKQCRVTQTGDVTGDGTNYEHWDNAKEFRVEKQTGAGTEVTMRQWQQRTPVVYLPEANATYTQEQPANDPRVVWEETTLENRTKKRTEYTYDDFNNVTSEKEYDFGDTSGSTGALVRQTFRTYAASGNGYCYTNLNGTDGACGGALAADANMISHQRRLLLSQTVKDGAGNQAAYSSFEYDNYNADGNHAALTGNGGMTGYDGGRFALFNPTSEPRGNVTQTSAWAGDSAYLNSYARYDNAGNVVSTKDPRGLESFVSYADQFVDGVGRGTFAFATATTSAVPDPTNQRGTNTPLTTSTVYDYATGQARSATDANGKTTTFQYNDPLARLTRVDRPDGGWTQYSYGTSTSAGLASDYVQTLTSLDGSRFMESWQFFDGFGRANRTFLKVNYSATPFSTTDTQYDALGRALTVTTPDSATVATSYSGNTVTVTDQAGKVRRSVTDGLGRLSRVDEPDGNNNLGTVSAPSQPTTYAYDALGSLRQVMQGTQQRYFMYDSLARLIRAKNPEQAVNPNLNTSADPVSGNTQWSMAYGYDANSNLESKTDARGVTTGYQYDNLNRVKQTNYTDGTPYTLNTYDFAANGRGRFYADYESSTTGTINYVTAYAQWDGLRRGRRSSTAWAQAGRRVTTAAGSTTRWGTSPRRPIRRGTTVAYRYDAAGRPGDDGVGYAFSSNLGDGVARIYAQNIQYDEASHLSKLQKVLARYRSKK